MTTTDVLQFRRALALIDDDYPFSASFGTATTREECIASSQRVFDRLTQGGRDEVLNFQVLARITELPDGSIDHEKLRSLVKVRNLEFYVRVTSSLVGSLTNCRRFFVLADKAQYRKSILFNRQIGKNPGFSCYNQCIP